MFNRLKKNFAPSGIEYLIVGLGNPGDRYANTRHNAGFIAIDALAEELDVQVKRIKYKSLCGEGELEGRRVLLMKPSTYMNLSDRPYAKRCNFTKFPLRKRLYCLMISRWMWARCASAKKAATAAITA